MAGRYHYFADDVGNKYFFTVYYFVLLGLIHKARSHPRDLASDGGGCERSSATLSNEQFILKPSHKEWKEIYLFHS